VLSATLIQLAVGVVSNSFFLDSGVDRDRMEVMRVNGFCVHPRLDGHQQQPFASSLTDPVAPLVQRGGMTWQLMPEQALAAQILPVRIFNPAFDHGFVRACKRMFQVMESGNQAGRQGWSPFFPG
jgi:hypothetical protein